MDRRTYVEQVLANLRRVTPGERAAIRDEIDGHIEDHICDLLELGYDEKLAEERAMSFMGDPVEVGRELDKQYPLRWLVFMKVVTVLLVMCCLAVGISLPGLRHPYLNLQARLAPKSACPAWVDHMEEDVDIRMEIGSDILYIFSTATEAKDDTAAAEVTVFYCLYDKDPIHYVSDSGVFFEDCRGEQIYGGAGGTSTAGAAYWSWSGEVLYGDPYITAVNERYGTRQTARVPLVWEEGL